MNDKKTNFTNFFVCDCGKSYKYRQGMFAHKKKCTFLQEEKIKDLQEENDALKIHLLEKISNENDFLKKQMEEKNKQINDLIPKIEKLVKKYGNPMFNNLEYPDFRISEEGKLILGNNLVDEIDSVDWV